MKTAFTKKFSTFILLMCGMFFFISASAQNRQPVNSLIGDISFINTFGYIPDEIIDEDLRIKTHLEYVENMLKQKDVSNLSRKLQLKRNHLLHDYWTSGIFPRNYDYKDRRPCFIDRDGRICAVGFLIEQTAGRQTAVAINAKHKYDLLAEMKDEMVDNWINNSGLTKEECVMIQPTYGPPPCNGNKVWACRISNCVTECKCVSVNNVAKWQASGHPCGVNGNGNLTMVSNGDLFLSTEQRQKGSLKIFDMTGRLVKTIADGRFRGGRHEIPWNTKDLTPGIYLLKVQSAESIQTAKLVVSK